MRSLDRRTALAYSGAALSAAAGVMPAEAADSKTKEKEKFAASPENTTATTPFVFTVVTTDLDASIKFYSGVLNYSVIDKGKTEAKWSNAPGIGSAGRRYVLMRGLFEEKVTERGVIRLLEAPPGTPPIRPPDSKNTDQGFIRFQARGIDADAAYANCVKVGFKPYNEPINYVTGPAVLMGEKVSTRMSRSISVPGPNRERLNITTGVDQVTHELLQKLPHPGNTSIINAGVTYCLDRWPFLDFYENAFGMKASDTPLASEAVNKLVGDPPGTKLFTGFLGNGFTEWKESRQFRPRPAPYPQTLDKTGHAMTTALADNLNEIRSRCKEHNIAIIGEGCLPTPDGKTREGFYIRGAVGELFEVIGRA